MSSAAGVSAGTTAGGRTEGEVSEEVRIVFHRIGAFAVAQSFVIWDIIIYLRSNYCSVLYADHTFWLSSTLALNPSKGGS